LNLLGALIFVGIFFKRRTETGSRRKKGCASAELETEPSESVPKESHPKVTAPPTQAAAPLGVVGWVLASVSVLVGFVIIAVATRIDGEAADQRRGNSFIPQAKMFRPPSDPIPRHSPTATVDEVLHSQHGHNTASTPQESALSEEKDPLDGKEVRKALPVGVQRAMPVEPANSN
jgi:hypothetical protein